VWERKVGSIRMLRPCREEEGGASHERLQNHQEKGGGGKFCLREEKKGGKREKRHPFNIKKRLGPSRGRENVEIKNLGAKEKEKPQRGERGPSSQLLQRRGGGRKRGSEIELFAQEEGKSVILFSKRGKSDRNRQK